jgi:hypothetical protein
LDNCKIVYEYPAADESQALILCLDCLPFYKKNMFVQLIKLIET